jgi:heme a synthase
VGAAAGVRSSRDSAVRLLAWLALLLAYFQTVFGAVVRITGSGMGCGEEWPRCRPAGSARAYWIPPLERPDLIIEVTHRYLAAAVGLAVVALYLATLARSPAAEAALQRRWALRAVLLVVAAAALGRETVRLGLSPLVVTTHLAIALLLLGVLAYLVIITGRAREQPSQVVLRRKTQRAAVVAAVMAFVVPVLGGLTATIPRAAAACVGFPHCRAVAAGGAPLAIHLTHRILAFLLFFHLLALAVNAQRRRELRELVHGRRLSGLSHALRCRAKPHVRP